MRLFFIAPLFVVIICILVNTRVKGQVKSGGDMPISVSGMVVDEDNRPLKGATILMLESQQRFISEKNGVFNITINQQSRAQVNLQFNYVGRQEQAVTVSIAGKNIDLGRIILPVRSLSLDSVSVVASQNSKASSNSSLIINRDIIEQTPALSIMDLLNQIPGRRITPPSLQSVQNINLRGVFEGTTSGRSAFSMNNAFGVAIVMDGNVISNNSNMQSFNPGTFGLTGSFLSSGAGYGLNGTSTTSYSGDYTFGGIDLRQIPADNIEKIEVVSGVASAKYGDLTDGAVIIERRAGVMPAYIRAQFRNNATTYSYSQGFKLSEDAGALSINIGYANSYADARDKLKAYQRINGGIMWSNDWGRSNKLTHTFSLDYGRNLDGIKQDPDDITRTKVRFDSWNFAVANRLNYRVDKAFLKNIGFNVRYSEGHQYSYREQQVNDAVVAYTDAVETGIHEGIYAPGIYTSYMIIDGRPINASARLDFNGEAKTAGLVHHLGFGINYSYGKNKGEGQMADPTRPRILARTSPNSSSPSSSERYYDFSRVIAQQDVGLYLEDNFNTLIGGRTLRVAAGARFDMQNGFLSSSPRVNANYMLNKELQIGLAYGLAFKSPGLAQRYPGPTFVEIPLLNAYNGKATESMYMVYVQRYEQTNKNLKSSRNQTVEFTSQYRKNGFTFNINVYKKFSDRGISTMSTREVKELPALAATFIPGAKPIVRDTGILRRMITTSQFINTIDTKSEGIELIINTPKIKAINTSFNLSGGYTRSKYKSGELTARSYADEGSNNTSPLYGRTGIYPAAFNVTQSAVARVSSITHIPKLSLVWQFIAECNILQRTKYESRAGIPLAYYNNNLDYIIIDDFNPGDKNYGHLLRPESEINADNMTRPLWNYHMSVAKEIRKRFKIAFNVFNVFNYQPYYINSGNTRIYPNAAPSFGAEISIKL
ncbi:TonB-dependent receptor plug domain-containing protein [Niabella sp. 22666]|uniref:TonB-dependent receptor plug domain-containing protein n=1 Tax=Niabella sp. 22666 TaxID=3453954 RepID=UPI003F83E2A1